MKYSRADSVRAYEKSVVLGGNLSLFPVPESLTNAFATTIQMFLRDAEDRAYTQGVEDARKHMRKALGIRE